MDWIKENIGEAYTEALGKKLSVEIGKRFVSRDDFNEVNEQKKSLDSQMKQRNTEELKTTDSAQLGEAIKSLQQENSKLREEHETQVQQMKLDNAVEKALAGVGAKNLTAVKAVMHDFLADAQLDESGQIKGVKDALQKLIKDENTGFLFDTVGQKQTTIAGASPANPDKIQPTGQSDFKARLQEAHKNKDTLAAIQIKQDAAVEGIYIP